MHRRRSHPRPDRGGGLAAAGGARPAAAPADRPADATPRPAPRSSTRGGPGPWVPQPGTVLAAARAGTVRWRPAPDGRPGALRAQFGLAPRVRAAVPRHHPGRRPPGRRALPADRRRGAGRRRPAGHRAARRRAAVRLGRGDGGRRLGSFRTYGRAGSRGPHAWRPRAPTDLPVRTLRATGPVVGCTTPAWCSRADPPEPMPSGGSR